MQFLAELRRRNVHRMAGLYLVAAWLVVQVAETLFPLFGYDETPARVTVIVLAIGFVPAVVFAWVFEITPEGLKRESEIDRAVSITPQTGRKMDRLIIGVLALALVYFAIDKFVLAPQREAATLTAVAEAARAEGRTKAIVESYGDKSIVVLPFADMSPAKDQEYMGDGLAEELLNLLAQIPELRVISRASAFSYKGKEVKLAQIANELSVAHILEGSVRTSGNTIRVTAQLIEARTDTHLWSQTWDRPLGDIFAVQDEIAAAVVAQLKIKLLGAAPKSRAVDPRAYALYLQGRQLLRQGHVRRSSELYQQAAALDGTYVAPWAGLAQNYAEWDIWDLTSAERIQRARESAAKAFALEPDHASTLAVLALIEIYDSHGLAAAASQLSRAAALEPSNADVLEFAAVLLRRLGRMDQAIALGEYLVVRDPVNTQVHYYLGNAYRYAGRLDEAIEAYRVALRLGPSTVGIHDKIAGVLLQRGEAQAALTEIQQEPSEDRRLALLALVYDALGRSAEADAALAQLEAQYAQLRAFSIAGIYASRGNADTAFEWLEKATQARSGDIGALPVYPDFAPLHSDARWLPLLHRLGMAPEQLAAIPFEVKLPR